MQKHTVPTRAQVANSLAIANRQIDNLCQLDNELLYALGSPIEFDEARGKIRDAMSELTVAAQKLRGVLKRMDEQ
jgi:hypothetical protein